MAEVAARMESPVDLWHTQNTCVALRDRRLPAWRRRAGEGDVAAARLATAFVRLCAAVVECDPETGRASAIERLERKQ